MAYIDYHSLKFFINGTYVNGLQDLNISESDQTARLNYLGNSSYRNIRNTYPVGNLSFNRQMYDKDFIFHACTGAAGFNGMILFNNNSGQNTSFNSGYLTNYGISFGLNQPPQMSYSVSLYGPIGKLDIGAQPFYVGNSGQLDLIKNSAANYYYAIPGILNTGTKALYTSQAAVSSYFKTGDTVSINNIPITGISTITDSAGDGITGYLYKKNTLSYIGSKGINLNISDVSNNRLIQASVNYQLDKLPIYTLGHAVGAGATPSYMHDIGPTNITCTLDFESETYSVYKNTDWPNSPKIDAIVFYIYDIYGNFIDSYDLGNMELVSQTETIAKNGSLRILASYRKTNNAAVVPTDTFAITILGQNVTIGGASLIVY